MIDGLPGEFVLGKNGKSPPPDFVEAMQYTQSLLRTGEAIGYHAVAAAPTVTMPRLKVFKVSDIFVVRYGINSMSFHWFFQALTSGAIGGYLDVAFNFNTQAFLDDNIIGLVVCICNHLIHAIS